MPPYYRHKPPRLHLGYLTKFTQETLFYVFYSMPGDEAQILAADELSHRGWWFHKEHKVGLWVAVCSWCCMPASWCQYRPFMRLSPSIYACLQRASSQVEPGISFWPHSSRMLCRCQEALLCHLSFFKIMQASLLRRCG